MSYKDVQEMYKLYALWNTKLGNGYTISIPEYKGTSTNFISGYKTHEIWKQVPNEKTRTN